MNTLIVFVLFASSALCAPVDEGSLQFAEDTLGNYKLNYNTKNSSRTEERSEDGKVVGSFAFLDGAGVKHTVTYVADGEEGFTAVGDDLPVAVAETEEVKKERAFHLALVAHEKSVNPPSDVEEEPVPVDQVLSKLVVPEIASLPGLAVPEEDVEVAAAKAEFLTAYAEDLNRLAEEYKRRV